MTSDLQIAANRRNAAQSTGPVTEEGKDTARFNALRHGLFARDVVLPGEDRAAYDELVAQLRADLIPEGPIEGGLIQRLADIWWRLGRSAAIESGLLSPDWHGSLDPQAHPVDPRLASGGGPLVDTFRVAIDETPTLDMLGRYEARLERAFGRTLMMLHRMQAKRGLAPPPPPTLKTEE